MVLFPRIGGRYWIVTDICETFCPVPVTLARKGGLFDYGNSGKGLFTVEWRLLPPKEQAGSLYEFDPNYPDEGYVEEYDVSRRGLFHTGYWANRVAKKLNRGMKSE